MSTPEVGDRVRVVHEGVVSYAGKRGDWVEFEGVPTTVYIHPESTVTVIEKAKKPLKVGDTIEGAGAYRALPRGAVVTDPFGVLVRTSGGFTSCNGTTYGPDFEDPRKLVYLPEQ